MRQRQTARGVALVSALCLGIGLGIPVQAASGQPRNTPPLAPEGLTVDDLSATGTPKPLSIRDTPLFGWLPTDRDPGEIQTAYEIEVKAADSGRTVWDSGRVVSDAQSSVAYAGGELSPATDYRWRVRTWDRADAVSPWSEPTRFTTAIGDGDWEGAEWISRDTDAADDYTLARTTARVTDSPVVQARAYMAANHTYELFLNGERADRGASFGYPGEGYYQVADVTDLVEPGSDLAVGIRYHWYGGGQGRPAAERGLLHKLVVEHADGTRQVIRTGEHWRVTRDTRFVRGADRRNGEGDRIDHQDGRGVVDGWSRADFDASGWQRAVSAGAHPTETFTHLNPQQTRLTETTVRPERLLTADDGTVVADFGKVIPARPAVRFDSGSAGHRVDMRAGYELTDDGRVNSSTLSTQSTNMAFPYVQAEGAQHYRAFTHLAFRYLEIPNAGEEIALDDVSAVVVHTDVPDGARAEVNTSNDTLNRVWDLLQRSALYSVQQQFVDTPTREKGQFLGDAANISYATMQGFGERVATRQAIREFLASQQRHWSDGADSGRYNAVYPNGDGKRDIPDYTEMFVDWVWRYYEVTGDESLLAEAYPAIRATAEYVLRHIPADGPTAGLVTNLSGGSGPYKYGIVDWPAPGRFGYDMDTAARTTVNALGVEVLRRTADMARVLGESGESVERYRTAERSLTETMNERLRADDGVYVDGLRADGTQSGHKGQHSTSYAIAFGVAPERDNAALAEYLADMGMRQGPMTAHWLLKALSDAGRPDAVLDLLTNADDHGWANILAQGGTFTWEAWNLDKGTNFSQSHGWGAQAAVDVVETLVGIRPGKPGGAAVDVVVPGSGLRQADGTVHTERGPVSLSWERAEHGVRAEVEIPVNVRATVALPRVDGFTYRPAGRTEATHVGTEDGQVIFEMGSGKATFVPVPRQAGR